MILIAGHPRCGQNYISRVLSTTNKKIGIGYVRADGLTFYDDDVPVIDGVVNFTGILQDIEFEHVIHIVRDPLKCISSSTTEQYGTYRLIFGTVKGSPKMKVRCEYKDFTQLNPIVPLWSWVHLNEAIEKKATYRFRIEDIDTEYFKLCELMGIDPEETVPDIPRDFNTRPHIIYTWDDLDKIDIDLSNRAKRLGKKYGYDTSNAIELPVDNTVVAGI